MGFLKIKQSKVTETQKITMTHILLITIILIASIILGCIFFAIEVLLGKKMEWSMFMLIFHKWNK